MKSNLPLITIGILSWNRLHYLRATLESARRCIKYPNIQWIVVDNVSNEPGLVEYLKSLDWIDEMVFMESTHVRAMNEIITRAKGELVLIWPDDIQFVVEGDWMVDCVEILMENHWIGSMCLSFQRRETIKQIWGGQQFSWKEISGVLGEIKRFGKMARFQKRIVSSRGFPIVTYGWKEDGIAGAGIASLTRTEIWKKLGPWKFDPGNKDIGDSSGGGEEEMLYRWAKFGMPLQRAITVLSTSADIINDDIGAKAKLRGKKRYGVYTPPIDEFYYQIFSLKEVTPWLSNELPVSFEDFVIPIGFELPLDAQGNLRKSGMNTSIVTTVDDEL